jgi:hypothetical protein
MARTTTEPLLLLPHQQQRQPPRTNRAWGAAVAVVLVLMLSLLLLRPSRPFGAPTPPRVELTLLAGATEKGAGTLCIRPCCSRLSSLLHESIHLARGSLIGDAIFVSVCLDGTPPGYHLQRGSGDGSNSWLIHLEVGAINHSHTFPKHT